jgi:DNA-directed RNA polymerase specialized sigma24 family protein
MTDRVEGRPLEDVELARLARDGDVHAYGELVERYREVAFRTAWLITRSSAEAEDAAQEAFVKAFYALGVSGPARRSGRGSFGSCRTRPRTGGDR